LLLSDDLAGESEASNTPTWRPCHTPLLSSKLGQLHPGAPRPIYGTRHPLRTGPSRVMRFRNDAVCSPYRSPGGHNDRIFVQSIDRCRRCGRDGRNRCGIRYVHVGGGGSQAGPGGKLEQCLVSTVVLRCDQLHRKLALRLLRGDRLLAWRLRVHHVSASAPVTLAARISPRVINRSR
jgi:hypothetical protein